jgi:hypothetical protein
MSRRRCFPKLKTDLLLVKGPFSPENVDCVQQLKEVPKNFMLMSAQPAFLSLFGRISLFFWPRIIAQFEIYSLSHILCMACPTDHFEHNVADFGGVRIITKHLAPPSPFSPLIKSSSSPSPGSASSCATCPLPPSSFVASHTLAPPSSLL